MTWAIDVIGYLGAAEEHYLAVFAGNSVQLKANEWPSRGTSVETPAKLNFGLGVLPFATDGALIVDGTQNGFSTEDPSFVVADNVSGYHIRRRVCEMTQRAFEISYNV